MLRWIVVEARKSSASGAGFQVVSVYLWHTAKLLQEWGVLAHDPTSARPPRVLVTRSAQQASALVMELRALGMDAMVVPGVEFVAPSSFADLDAALGHIETFDWLLFTSANAVHFLAAHAPHFAQKRLPPIGVVGAATASALHAAGLRASLVAPQAVAESLAEALLPYARRADLAATRFLLVRAEEAREHLPETLRAAGAEVTVAPAYRTVVPEGSVRLVQDLFAERASWPEAMTFTSSSTVRNLVALCTAAGVALPEPVLRVSIGPITSATLRECGYPPHAEAEEASVASLARAAAAALRLRRSA